MAVGDAEDGCQDTAIKGSRGLVVWVVVVQEFESRER
jgi:hypothetical protein